MRQRVEASKGGRVNHRTLLEARQRLGGRRLQAIVPVGGGRSPLAFGIAYMNERGIDLLAWVMGIIAAVLALYFLTAPPIMTAIVKQSGTMSFPAIYQPIMGLIESDFNGPVLWYFNDVWNCGIIVLGEDSTPWHVVMVYAALAIGLLGALVFPFWRRILKARKA